MSQLTNNIFTLIFFILVSTLSATLSISAQSEIALARSGNKNYESKDFVDAEMNYKRAIRSNEESDLDAAVFNLGNAYYQQQRFDEAVEQFNKVVSTIKDKPVRSQAFHNLGNIYLGQKQYEQAIEMYKESLRLNPSDDETRYNMAYAKELLKNESQEEKEERDKQCDNPKDSENENQEKKEDKEKKEDQEEKEQEEKEDQEKKEDQEQKEEEEQEEKDQEQKDQEQKDQEQKEKEEQEQKEKEEQEQKDEEKTDEEKKEEESKSEEEQEPQEPDTSQMSMPDSLAVPPEQLKMSKDEIMRLLEALKNEELKVQEKLRNQKGKSKTIKSDKDW